MTGKNLLATVMAEKVFNRKMLHGMLETSADIKVSELLGIRIIPRGGDWIAIQVITSGINNPIQNSWVRRTKKIIKKSPKKENKKEKVQFKAENETLF